MSSNPLLCYEWVNGDQSAADQSVVMLHGILGQKRNLFGFARRFVKAFPDLKVLLVDLRNHGDSQGFMPPHGLKACANDLNLLLESLKIKPKSLIGHSFGAGVALTFARNERQSLSSLWLLDAVPALNHQMPRTIDVQTDQILNALVSCTPPKTRGDFISCLKACGISDGICNWLAMNLSEQAGKMVFRPDPQVAREMIDDFLKSFVVSDFELGNHLNLFLVQAERNLQWKGAISTRINELEREAKLKVLCLPKSGHWVHIDNPEALLEMMRPDFA